MTKTKINISQTKSWAVQNSITIGSDNLDFERKYANEWHSSVLVKLSEEEKKTSQPESNLLLSEIPEEEIESR